MATKKMDHPPKVLKALYGEILKIERYHDKQILEVGMDTKSGGKILTLKFDTEYVADMYAEIGILGSCTAISAIVI